MGNDMSRGDEVVKTVTLDRAPPPVGASVPPPPHQNTKAAARAADVRFGPFEGIPPAVQESTASTVLTSTGGGSWRMNHNYDALQGTNGLQGLDAHEDTEPDTSFMSADRGLGASAGWRRMWAAGMDLGKGIHSETGHLATYAIQFKPVEEPAILCKQIQAEMKVLSSAEEFAKVVSAGGSLSLQGWGGSAGSNFSWVNSLNFSTSTIIGVVVMRYMSDGVVMVNPTDPEQDVKLDPVSKAILETKGPEEFRRVYGTHFIAGYTLGGIYVGSYELEFESAEKARKHAAGIKASFEGAAAGGGASAQFEKDIRNIKDIQNKRCRYFCLGWSNGSPPKLPSTLKDLVEAQDQVDTGKGLRKEVILRRYCDVYDYREAKAKYFKAHPGEDTGKRLFLSEEHYGTIMANLNDMYLRVDYICRQLQRSTKPALIALYKKAKRTRLLFESKLMLEEGDEVRENLKALEMYTIVYRGQPAEKVKEEDRVLWLRGRNLYKDLNEVDSIEHDLREEFRREAAKQAIPKAMTLVPRSFWRSVKKHLCCCFVKDKRTSSAQSS